MVDLSKSHVAYFSMEVGINPKVPTYSGGLGVLAGDTLRSCADLKVPVVGVTLLYKKGFFKQRIDLDGNQVETEVDWNPEDYMTSLDKEVFVSIDGRKVKVTAWLYEIDGCTGHKNPIVFLDTDHAENDPYDRSLTDKLYANDSHYRLSQEVILGIGGTRMLEVIGCNNISKYHMNEGHSALLTLELFNRYLYEDETVSKVRKHCVFTTHTPVPAGHDAFPRDMVEGILQGYITDEMRDVMYNGDELSMTHLALKFSRFINGVAKKHGEVSRQMFPGYHIESITNGVHSAFWTSEPYQKLFDEYISGWRSDPFGLRSVLSIPDEKVWDAHMESKKILMDFLNTKYDLGLDPEVFTIGFARRAASYKRGDMLFSDIERLKSIASKVGKIQILFAGKAHPNDFEGKQIIKNIINHMKGVKHDIKVWYIENYNIDLARKLIPGVDVWLNTPMRPREASGTSGMKAAHNGVPHFSTLDGWWIEGHIEKKTGFSIGDHPKDSPEPSHEKEVDDMYSKLEYVIVPRYYKERDKWISMMKHSIALNGGFFNTHRMVQQYVLNAYFS